MSTWWWLPVDRVPDWPEALCPGKPPEWWDADAPTRHYGVAVCQACPVRVDCLGWGAEHEETGVWGGVVLRSGKPGVAR